MKDKLRESNPFVPEGILDSAIDNFYDRLNKVKNRFYGVYFSKSMVYEVECLFERELDAVCKGYNLRRPKIKPLVVKEDGNLIICCKEDYEG